MKFGPQPLDQAEGGILAHSLMLAGRKLAKGTKLAAPEIAALRADGRSTVVVALLEPGDIAENDAATQLAAAIAPNPAHLGLGVTLAHAGRVNLHALGPGVVVMDTAAVHAMNRIDPAITLATLPAFARVAKGTLVGTVKVISYAVSGVKLRAACANIAGALRVAPVVHRSAGLVLTCVPGQPDKLNEKGRAAVATRLRALGMTLAEVRVVPHDEAAICAALRDISGDMVLILTGSATSDLYDTAPEALRAAGGSVTRFGMPVDPGNLLFLGNLGVRAVIGLPGCVRSVALNGADWVLERLACGFDVRNADISAMGVGGLLKEIPIRPQPREG